MPVFLANDFNHLYHFALQKFAEARVDGEFLLDLREEDLSEVLGIQHKLHRRKILLARDKIRPLSKDEERRIKEIEKEEKADDLRMQQKIPDLDTVFSQARHGRLKRLEQSLDEGFDVNTKDQRGNTLLIVAVQNGHRKMIDILIRRDANVNHTNLNGNSPLHFALAYDQTGQIAEYLIEKGSDDTIENGYGLTCYDGLGVNEEQFGMV